MANDASLLPQLCLGSLALSPDEQVDDGRVVPRLRPLEHHHQEGGPARNRLLAQVRTAQEVADEQRLRGEGEAGLVARDVAELVLAEPVTALQQAREVGRCQRVREEGVQQADEDDTRGRLANWKTAGSSVLVV